MATAYGRDTPQNQYVSPLDVNFITKSLLTMQDKYDKNKAALDKTMSQITSIQIDHKPTQEHFQNNLKKVMQGLQGENGNIAFGADMTQVENYIQTAIDDAVIAGYQGTVAKQRIQQQAAKFREEGKGLYSDANLAYSMKDFEDWENDPRVGAYYKGNTNYVPYTDTSKIEKDLIKSLKPNESVSVRKDGVYILSESGERLADTHIQQMVEKEMKANPNYAKQIEINSWVGYKDRSFEDVYKKGIEGLTSLRNDYARKAQEYNAIELVEKMGKDGKKQTGVKMDYPDDASRNMYMQKQSQFALSKANEIESFLNEIKGIDVNNLTDKQKKQYKEMIGGTLGKETYSFSVGKSFAFDNIKKKDMKADSFEVAKFQENNRNWRFGEEMKLKREEMAFDQNVEAEKLKLAAAKLYKDGVINADQASGYGVTPDTIQFIPTETDSRSKTDEEVKADVDVIYQTSGRNARENLTKIVNLDNSLDEDEKAKLLNALDPNTTRTDMTHSLVQTYIKKVKNGQGVGKNVPQNVIDDYIQSANTYIAARKTKEEFSQYAKGETKHNIESYMNGEDMQRYRFLKSKRNLSHLDRMEMTQLVNKANKAIQENVGVDRKTFQENALLDLAHKNGLALNTNQVEIDLTSNKALLIALKNSGELGSEYTSMSNDAFQKYLDAEFSKDDKKEQLIPKIKVNPKTGELFVNGNPIELAKYPQGSAVAQTVNTIVYQNQEKQKAYQKSLIRLAPLLSQEPNESMAYKHLSGDSYNLMRDKYNNVYLQRKNDSKKDDITVEIGKMPVVGGNSEDFIKIYETVEQMINKDNQSRTNAR